MERPVIPAYPFGLDVNGCKEGVVKICIPGYPEFIGIARQAVDAVGAQARMDSDERMALTIAVGEACNNAVLHTAIPDRDGGFIPSPIEISCRILPDAVEIDVLNQGESYAPEGDVPEMPSALAESGRGIPLMRMLMDDVQFRRVDGGTVVHLLKRRGGGLSTVAATHTISEPA